MQIKRKTLWSLVTLVLAVLTVWLVFKSSGMSVSALWAMLKDADPVWMLPSALCAVGMIYFEGQAVLTLLRRSGYKKSQRSGFLYAAADCYFSAITPSATGGQPASAFFMMKGGVPAAVVTACLLANLVMYNTAILAVGTLCIVFRSQLFLHFQPVSRLLIVLGITVLAIMDLAFLGLLWKQQILSKAAQAGIHMLTKLHLMKHPERWEEKLRLSMREYKTCVNILSGSRRVWLLSFLFNVLQRVCQFLVTVFVYLAIRPAQGSPDPLRLVDLWSTQCFVSLGSNCVPIPGSMGVTDYLMLDGYLNLMDRQTAYQLQLLARGFAFYLTVLLSGLVVLIAYLILKKRKGTHPREGFIS